MIPLAAIEGNVIFVIVAAVVGVINWLMEKSKKASGAKQPPPSARPAQPPSNAGGESEQERLRRFLEALGVPQQPQQPSRPAQSQMAPPATKQPQPIPRRVAQDIKGRMPSPRATGQKPAKVVRPPKRIVVQDPEEFATAGRLEEAATSIEKISGEFSAINVRVKMEPVQTPDRPAHIGSGNAGTTSVLERDGSPIAATLRKLLHNPRDLRATFVAMEVLGTPKGLQN